MRGTIKKPKNSWSMRTSSFASGYVICAEKSLSHVKAFSPNIVLIDTRLPEMDGIDACRRLTGNGHDCDVIMLSTEQM